MKTQKSKFYNVSLGFLIISLSLLLFSSLAISEGIVGIRWNANPESSLAGYKLYFGTAPGIYESVQDVGNVTEHYVTNLQPGITYYFPSTADDLGGNESGPSSEISTTLQPGITYYFPSTADDLGGNESEPSSEISTTLTFDSYFLTMDVQGMGEITSEPPGITCTEGEDCRTLFPSGTTLTLLAIPGNENWQFVEWGGDCSGTESCTVQLMADQIVTATFTTETKGDGGGSGDGIGGDKK